MNESAQVSPCPWMCTCITNTNPVYRNGAGTIPKAIRQYSERSPVVFRNDIGSIAFFARHIIHLIDIEKRLLYNAHRFKQGGDYGTS